MLYILHAPGLLMIIYVWYVNKLFRFIWINKYIIETRFNIILSWRSSTSALTSSSDLVVITNGYVLHHALVSCDQLLITIGFITRIDYSVVCRRHLAKPRKHSAKFLPSVTLDKAFYCLNNPVLEKGRTMAIHGGSFIALFSILPHQ